jgi:hypothetical protein
MVASMRTSAEGIPLGGPVVPDEAPAPDPLAEDVVEKVNAGAGLAYALHYCPDEVLLALPDHVRHAVTRAQSAYGITKN